LNANHTTCKAASLWLGVAFTCRSEILLSAALCHNVEPAASRKKTRYGVTDRNPCTEVSLLPENNKRVRYLLDDEEQRLLSVLTGPRGHLLPLVVLAIGTGMRRGDLFNLTSEKVDFQRGLIYVPNSKTGRDYAVPMNEDVKATLKRIRSTVRGGGWFLSTLTLPSLTPTSRQRSVRLVS
jgi:integrase